MTAWMCAVRVVEFNIEVPNYWLCLPMSDPHLSLYNSFLPKAWMMCKLHVCRTAVLLVVKEKKKKNYCFPRILRFCFWAHVGSALSCAVPFLLRMWRKEAVWSCRPAVVFSFSQGLLQVLSKCIVFVSPSLGLFSRSCLLWSGVFIYILCKIKTTRCLLWGDIRMHDVWPQWNIRLVTQGDTYDFKQYQHKEFVHFNVHSFWYTSDFYEWQCAKNNLMCTRSSQTLQPHVLSV